MCGKGGEIMRDFTNSPQQFDPSKGSQEKQTSECFFERPKTRTMVSVQTGIPTKNIDRYIAQMKKTGNLRIVKKGICEITRHAKVEYLTNNPAYFPNDPPQQMNLFD